MPPERLGGTEQMECILHRRAERRNQGGLEDGLQRRVEAVQAARGALATHEQMKTSEASHQDQTYVAGDNRGGGQPKADDDTVGC